MTFCPCRCQTLTAPLLALAALWCLPSHAARPLAVDDANVNDVGAGHVEAWLARQGDGSRVWTLAPAYGLTDGVEIGASFAKDADTQASTTSIQVKLRLTESKTSGCNLGAVLGATQTQPAPGTTPFALGLLTCNGKAGALHINLGAQQAPDSAAKAMWGIAFERDWGKLTPHIEVFGQEQAAPTAQIGLKGMWLKNLQWDGTVGTNSGQSVFTLGLKYFF
jgi:hypothetical protein